MKPHIPTLVCIIYSLLFSACSSTKDRLSPVSEETPARTELYAPAKADARHSDTSGVTTTRYTLSWRIPDALREAEKYDQLSDQEKVERFVMPMAHDADIQDFGHDLNKKPHLTFEEMKQRSDRLLQEKANWYLLPLLEQQVATGMIRRYFMDENLKINAKTRVYLSTYARMLIRNESHNAAVIAFALKHLNWPEAQVQAAAQQTLQLAQLQYQKAKEMAMSSEISTDPGYAAVNRQKLDRLKKGISALRSLVQ